MPECLPKDLEEFRSDLLGFLVEKRGLSSIELRKECLTRGIYKIPQPIKYGGSDAGPLKLAISYETVALAGISKISDVIGPGPGILSGANAVIEANYLSPMLRGEKIGSFAFTEADPSNPTVATWTGDNLKVTGKKSYVSSGYNSDFMSVVLNVKQGDGSLPSGPAVVVIDAAVPGVLIGDPFVSLDGSAHSEVTFKDVLVSPNDVVGTIGEGIPRAIGGILKERLEQAAIATGMALYAMTLVTEHLRIPHRSGGTLGDLEGVRLRYGEMRINTFATRSTLYRAARILEADPDSINEVTSAKVFCTETASSVIDSAVQLVGGRALIEGQPLEAMYRKIRSMRLAGGATDILRLSVSKGALEFDSGIL